MSKQMGLSTLGVFISSILLIWAFLFENDTSETLRGLSDNYEFHMQKLDKYKSAEASFKNKATTWASVNREGLMRETSPHDLQKQITTLSRFYKFKNVALDFQEMDHSHSPPQLELHKVHLRIKSPYDRNIFQFLTHMKSSAPGLFTIEKMALERVEKEGDVFVEGNLKLTWLHREEGD